MAITPEIKIILNWVFNTKPDFVNLFITYRKWYFKIILQTSKIII